MEQLEGVFSSCHPEGITDWVYCCLQTTGPSMRFFPVGALAADPLQGAGDDLGKEWW